MNEQRNPRKLYPAIHGQARKEIRGQTIIYLRESSINSGLVS